MSLKILIVCPELPRNDRPGTMAPAARQIESLRKLGLSIDVVDMQGMSKLKYLHRLPQIRRRLGQVDLVHAHFGFCGWLANISAKLRRANPAFVLSFMGSDLLGTPVNPQGDLQWFSRVMVQANRRLAWKPDEVIVKSKQMAERIAPAPCTVIPNGVDIEKFRPLDRQLARHQLGLHPTKRLVLFPGNPANPRKGHQLARDAVREASRITNREIDLVPLWNVDPDDAPLYMNACDMMVMTSLLEGSPNVVKEAMACNAKVVGVAVGDVEELINDVNGCEFCQRSPEAVGRGIARALESSDVRSREAVLAKKLDLDTVARRIVQVYQRAIGKPIVLPRSHCDLGRACEPLAEAAVTQT